MKIIDAQSAVPTSHDGLAVYSGLTTIAVAGVSRFLAKEVKIKTKCANIFYVSLRAHFGTVAKGATGVLLDLPYTLNTESDGTKSISVYVPGGNTLQYYITGSVQPTSQISHDDITTIGDANQSHILELEVIIAAAGTTAVQLLNTTGVTFAYTKPATGQYVITASSAILKVDKSFLKANLEGGVGITVPYIVLVTCVSTTVMQVDISIADGTGVNAPARIFLGAKIYP